jgi:hypothetical protein
MWTLQHLCFGPDVAADYSDREENRDSGHQQKNFLTREARIENGPAGKCFSDALNVSATCSRMPGLTVPSVKSSGGERPT